jgi:hypothetical protein
MYSCIYYIQCITGFLKLFKAVTLHASKSLYPIISAVDPLFNVLFKKIKDFKLLVKDLEHLEIINTAQNAAMDKLNKYYS